MEEEQTKKWFPKKILGANVTALMETLIFLTLAVAGDWYFGDGNRFIDVHPHPFWVIILLVASLYGTIDALVATGLATLFLYVDNVPAQAFDETVFDYQLRLTMLPFMWFSASFILGEIRYRRDEDNQRLTKELRLAKDQNRVITRQYSLLKTIKENIETRMTSQEKTTANVYQTFKTLETLNPARLLIALDEVVKNVLNPKKFSVFAKGTHGFEAAICHGWEQDDAYQRRFSIEDDIYLEVAEKKRLMCVVNRDDEKMLKNEGVVVSPLVDRENGEVFGMIKIEEMDFEALNLSNIEAFKGLCDCIGMAYAQAKKYQKAQKEAIFSDQVKLYSSALQEIIVGKLSLLAEEKGFPISSIKLTSRSVIAEDPSGHELEIFTQRLVQIVPKTAVVFHGKRKDMSADIVLPSISVKDAELLSHSILENLSNQEDLGGWNFVMKVTALVEISERDRSEV